MKAREFLTQVQGEYKRLRETRGRLYQETDREIVGNLRNLLKKESAYYAAILNAVWDTIDQVEPPEDGDILVRKYIFFDSCEQIARDIGWTHSRVMAHHKKAVRQVQKIVEGKGEVQ